MKKHIVLLMIIFQTIFTYATHNRAGEITYKQISEHTYEITLTTYTYTKSAANESRDQLEIMWGDNYSSWITRISIKYLANDIQKNIYKGTHEFPGPGVYEITMSDKNRNADIVNIPGSVNVVFTVKTILKIDPDLGVNNAPILLNPPIDRAALGRRFVYNPSAYDPDGDSLSYKLTICLGANAEEIPGYEYPETSDTLYVDPVTGDFVWDAPVSIGEYNVAMEIIEWRSGVIIGKITRDMQIEVEETDNNPPVIDPLINYCVTAGDTIEFEVTASDPDNETITLTATGGPFEFERDSAIFDTIIGTSPVSQTFTWHTKCAHIRGQVYKVLFKAEDDNREVKLTSYEESNITVVGPAPENLVTSPSSNTIILSWDTYECLNAEGFKIYRRESSYNFTPANCETGMPDYAGYSLIATQEGSNITSYIDNGTGNGLTQGFEYCYRITAYFSDGSESYVSEEVCEELQKGTPIFIETSVEYTREQDGSIHLAWIEPTEFDAVAYPGPYKYILESSNDLYGQNYSSPVNILGINNTSCIDTNINTIETAKSYKLTFYNNSGGGNWEQVGTPAYSASPFIVGKANDRRMLIEIEENTPWKNTKYVIYRKDADENCNINSDSYITIDTVSTNSFLDRGLVNENNYWYKVKTIGKYDLLPNIIYNYSQEICVSPQDTIPPCQLNLTVESDCDLYQNYLNWTLVDACSQDVDNFLIFYSDTEDGELQLIATIDDNTIRTFTHIPENSLGACYGVSAQDSAGNYLLPQLLVKICVDNCEYYKLPNVFTPDGDGKNDLYIPFPYDFVEKIDLKIYNRWGVLVFETDDPDINWDGTDVKSGKIVSDGIYYYLCDVYEKRLSGTEPRNLNGFIHIFGNKKNPDQN